MIGVAPNINALLRSTWIGRKTELISGGISIGEVNINRDIFKGDSLSALLFSIPLVPLTLVLRWMKTRIFI